MRPQKLVQAVEHLPCAQVLDVADGAGEIVPEVAQQRLPVDLAVRHLVELLLEIGGEIVADIFGEERLEEGGHDPAFVLGIEPLLLQPNVVAILEHRDGRGVGRGTADAKLLHPLDQRRLGVAGRRLGEVLARVDPLLGELLVLAHRREAARLLVLLVVPAFLVEGEEARKAHDLAGGAEFELARAGLSQNVDGRALELGAFHLGGDGARPDEFVELGLLGLEMAGDVAGALRHVGRADRLMRLLRVLGLGGVLARRGRYVILAEVLGDDAARRRNRFRRQIDTVGAHIGDEAGRAVADVDAFVQALCDLHGARRRKTQLARRLLLQGGRGERRIGVAPDRLRFDSRDREQRLLERGLERFGLGARADVEARDLLAVRADQAGGEGRIRFRSQMGDDRPVFARDELFDLELPVADDAQSDRLHPPRRARARQLAPQHRGEGEADQIVERAPRPIGVDQRVVDLARMAHRLQDRVLGHRIEHHAIDALVLEQLLALENFMNVPRDRLALPVRVGRQDHAVGALHGSADVAKPLGGLRVDLPTHGEIVVWVYRTIFGRQIPHMTERGVDSVVLAQIFVDGLRLGGRLDDHNFHSGSFLQRPTTRSRLPSAVRSRDMERPKPAVKFGRTGSGAAQAALSMSVFEKSSPL